MRHASWFGDAESPLLGHVHLPADGRARGAVVLCPPLGKEHLDTYRGVKALAEQLVERGLAALRFDYEGTGDSAGDQDSPDAVAAWHRSVATAVATARASGVEHVTVAGLRAGALIAATALPGCGPVDAAVLWDPIVSGRALLREQRALYRLALGADDPDDPRVSIVGGVLAPEAADALGALRIDPCSLAGARTLLATRPVARETATVSALAAALDGDELSLDGHESFTTPSTLHPAIPTEHLTRIADWIAAAVASSTAREVRFPARERAVVATTGTGLPIHESVEYLGPKGMFALRTHGVGTEDADGPRPPAPTVLFFGTAYEHRLGPSRLWVELAREFAAHGISSVRFDRTGVGDTGTAHGSAPTPLYSDASDRDALDAVAALGIDPQDLAAIGLCSGAWYSSWAALRGAAHLTVLVNVILWCTHRRKSLRANLSPDAPDVPAAGAPAEPETVSLRARIKPWAQKYLPYPLWLLLGRLGVTQVPEVGLEALRRAGVSTTVVLSAEDHRWFLSQRGEEGLRRVRRRGFTGDILTSDVGDHTGRQRDGREFLRTAIISAVLARFGTSTTAPVADERVS
ncbi:serine aminopeptidase domain-containing protein [Rhodococcus sp. B50]|uniref:serine aminopeptidase domain-containing protein n=1 Tax=Rhodococcus sp. B50 TaxID=2682847 RepID=UPI0027DE963D|nr:alpha/beta hydrolase [Rhodococcus sp. B50]